MMSEISKFSELRKIDVSGIVEKKMGLSYLSWAWAVDTLLKHDPAATWEYKEPVRWNDTVMVFCTVKAFGVERTAQLPVMDHRNKAVPNPDAFQVNTAMQRCLAKAIALHGIGLYIYAGEDVPKDQESANPLDAIKPVAPAETVPVVKPESNPEWTWHLMYPNKTEPAASYMTSDEWEDMYNQTAMKTAKSGSYTHRERMTKLRELKEANQATLDKLDPVRKLWHGKQYADRLKSLGAAMPPAQPEVEPVAE
jgi:hypothetical protein